MFIAKFRIYPLRQEWNVNRTRQAHGAPLERSAFLHVKAINMVLLQSTPPELTGENDFSCKAGSTVQRALPESLT